MKIAIVHISDLHLKSISDVGFKRLEKLANMISYSRSALRKNFYFSLQATLQAQEATMNTR